MRISLQADITSKKSQLINPPGATGTQIYGGWPIEKDFTPPALQSTDRVKTFDKMRLTDPMIKASLLMVSLPIRSAKWDILPASEESKDIEISDYIRANLFESQIFSWNDFLRSVLLYLPFGFYPFAKRYRIEEGKLILEELEPRLPETIQKWHRSKENGDLERIEQFTLGYDDRWQIFLIPRERLVYFCNDREGDDWRGESILRSAYGAWWRKDVLLRLDAIRHERFSVPTPKYELREGFQEGDYDRAKEILENYRSHEKGYLIQMPGDKIDFLTLSSTAMPDIQASIDREDRYILFNVLGQFMNLGNTETGSRSVGEVHSDLFYGSLQFVANDIATTLEKDLIRELVDVNFGEQKSYPKISVTKLQKPNIALVLDAISKLIPIGVLTTDENIEKTIRDLMDLPEKTEEEQGKKPNIKTEPVESEDLEMIDCKCGVKHLQDEGQSGFRREMTDVEKSIKLDDISKKLEKQDSEIVSFAVRYKNEMSKELVRKGIGLLSRKLSFDQFSEQLSSITVPMTGKMENELAKELKTIFEWGRQDVRRELKGIKAQSPTDPVTAELGEAIKVVKPRARWIVEELASLLKLEFSKEMQRQRERGIIDSSTLFQKLTQLVAADTKMLIKETINTLYGIGRTTEAEQRKDEIGKVIRSELMDSNTCKNCEKIDGMEYMMNNPEAVDMLGGPYLKCEGGDQCRGINIFIGKEE